MHSIQENLLSDGWNLSTAGLDLLTENGKITDIKTVVKKLLDTDLRSVSQGTLPEDFSKVKYEVIPGGIVLQLQKVKNLSSPKYQEVFSNPNPSIMKLVLTDGVQNVQGVAMESIPSLHLNTLPGSKIMLTGEVEIAHCFLLLTQENTSFIGGRVEQLIEKWELNRKLAKHRRDTQEEGGPPPWIPFGQKITKQVVADKNFKSLEQGKQPKDVVENLEFETQRKDAIMEASKIGAPKVFGGGNNKLLDHNVQVIVDAGFTIEQAEYALKLSKNNTDRALRSLQSKTSKPGKEEGPKGKVDDKGERGERGDRGKGGKGRGRHREEDGASSLKPSGKVSLFDFLEDKLPVSEKEFTAPAADFRNSFDRKGPKPGKPGGERGDRSRPFGEDRRGRDEPDHADRPPFRRADAPGNKHDGDRKSFPERKPEGVRYEGKKLYYDQQRNDKSFGNFKVKSEFTAKTEMGRIGPRWSEKRDPKPGGPSKSYGKPDKGFEEEVSRKPTFIPPNEKPPRFQKTNQPGEQVPLWSDPPPSGLYQASAPPASYPRLPQQVDFQLQNSLAGLSLQQNIANFNHTSQDHLLPSNLNKNLFYQNLGAPVTAPSAPSEVHRAPPPAAAPAVPPLPIATAYQRRSPQAPPPFLQQEMKTTAYPGLPTVPDYPYKTNGTMMQGFSDFQAVFGNAPRATNNAYNSQPLSYSNSQSTYNNTPASYNTSANYNNTQNSYNTAPPAYNNAQPTAYNAGNNYNAPAPGPGNSYANYTAPFMSAQQLMQPPPPTPQQAAPAPPQPRRWSWKKGHKCYARYWEDQNYYEALVTGVSENTCVVHFIEYGNFEEVLHDDCVPIDGISPET